MFYKEGDKVITNCDIAIIENTANYDDVLKLKELLKLTQYINDSTHYVLGEIQLSFSTYSQLSKEYHNFKKLDFHNKKIKSIDNQLSDNEKYVSILQVQKDLFKESLKVAERQYNREKRLFSNGVISKSEIDVASKTFLSEKLKYENIKSTVSSAKMQNNILKQQKLDLELQKLKEELSLENRIEEARNNLLSNISAWERKYVISSSIDGIITFTRIWKENQNVKVGELVATIIPFEQTNIIGKLTINPIGIGKVKVGQTVNIKPDNFPYMEFGLLKGQISTISLVPEVQNNETVYMADVVLNKRLLSSYGKRLKFSQNMEGNAEIITEDTRLLERLLYPLKSIWVNDID